MSYLRSEFVEQPPFALDPGYSRLLRLIIQRNRTEDHPSGCLSTCLSAAALAAFSARPDAKAVETKTRRAYALALSAVNKAIQQPDAAEDDQLLAAVLLLAFYEVNTCQLKIDAVTLLMPSARRSNRPISAASTTTSSAQHQ